MKLKVFTFRVADSAHGFDDAPLQRFVADKEVVDFNNHFFIHDKTPYLTVIISYPWTEPDKGIPIGNLTSHPAVSAKRSGIGGLFGGRVAHGIPYRLP